MRTKIGVQILTAEPETRLAILAALESSASLEVEGTSSGFDEFKARLQERPVHAALVDIDPQPSEMLQDLERISGRFAATRFVVLSRRLESDLVIRAMQAGARHFLQKESIGPDLALILRRLVPEDPAGEEREGTVTLVLSASGGCGSTLIAANLAQELQLAAAEPTLLVDLDWDYGAISACLDVSGQFGVADLLLSEDRVDPELIRSTAVPRSESLHVLVNPGAVDPPGPAARSLEGLSDILRAGRRAYAHMVVDAPRLDAEACRRLHAASDATLLVFQLTVKDLRRARGMTQWLASAGGAQGRVIGLANRHIRKHPLVNLEDARKALAGIEVEPISNDYKAANLSLNYGQPLAQTAPKSPLRKDIKALADRIRSRAAPRD